ncbi:uncharacterized protein LODBEIA_P21580 [Lodderomyces beijingensis]|uniref:Polynucleotide 5'-hydroxyl-kinase GRC3 n=1 Tax=Lodderomyces beijingensis TaxID=1775926 RepID=A0ABP0ZIE5_9ASCO
MSIPGFGGIDTSQSDDSTLKTMTIPALYEWRIEVPMKKILQLKVTSGILEINGTELANNVEIKLCGVKYAVYAPKVESQLEYCLLPHPDTAYSLSAEDEEFTEYISDETNMDQIVNLHMYIQSRRQIARDSTSLGPGPRVLVIGNKQSGKTSLCKTLVSYAAKMGETPILVNLDPAEGVFCLPGSISATAIPDSLDLESCGGYGISSTTTGNLTQQSPKVPLVKNYGFLHARENEQLYRYVVDQLGICVLSKLESDEVVRSSGCIVDTPALGMGEFDTISAIVADFKIDLVVVVGSEKLKMALEKKLKHRAGLSFVKISKSAGVVDVSDEFIRMTQEQSIREYFNGNFRTRLSPFKTEISLSGLVIYKAVLGRDVESSMSFLPAGDDFEKDEDTNAADELKEYFAVLDDNDEKDEDGNGGGNGGSGGGSSESRSKRLENSIVVITQLDQPGVGGGAAAEQIEAKELLNTSVLGYVHVSKVDEEKKRMKVLLPFPGVFPRHVLISTSVRYNE